MEDSDKTKAQLINELAQLRQRIQELERVNQDPFRYVSVPEPLSLAGRLSNESYEPFISIPHNYQYSVPKTRKYHISELIDMQLLQQLFDSFFELTGIMHAFLDVDTNILSRTGWSDICLNFHRKYPQTECRCKQSDCYIKDHLHESTYIKYRCLNGLIEYATPIIVEGQHLATIYMGQLFNEPPDEDFFRRQAQEFGFDEAAYLEALHKIRIMPEHRIKPIMEFLSKLGQVLASMGLERLRRIEAADQVVQEKEERLSLILEASNDGFWDWNIKTGEIYFSSHCADILGYSPGEIGSDIHTWMQLIHPDDSHHIWQTINEHLAGKTEKYEAEYRMLTKSGKWKWIMDHGQVIERNKEDQPLRMAGTILDITNRKQSEMALHLSEKKFFKAFHCNADPMSITTLKEGRYVEVNEAFLKFTGYKESEVIGYTSRELGIWAIAEQRELLIAQIQENGSIQNSEVDFRLKSGEVRTTLISFEIIDIDNEAHLLISTRDITQRKQMEDQLRLSEECFAKAFNTSPLLMIISTLEEGRFIKANNSFCSTTGYSCDKIIGRTTLELGIWANPAERFVVKQKIMTNHSVKDMEICFYTAVGEQRLGLYSAERLDVHGESCILSILTDITELRKMETEMTRLDRLNVVGQMAASIGHEIRNPMTTVRGYLQILHENKKYMQEWEYFDLMIEELDRANSIITEFLSLAKNKVAEFELTSLNTIITKLMPLIEAKAMSRDQYVRLELGYLPDLSLDFKEIRQLILNLVNNGMESMSSAGVVTIKTYIENKMVVLAIQDEGNGIDYELLDKLGTPFLTTKEQGTGLGLSVCYRIAARHNAKVHIDTSPTGTTFYVKFPLC